NSAERFAHLLLLLFELRTVGEILEPAAAAGRVVGARRVDALRARFHDLDREGLGVAPLHVGDAREHRVAREAAADEDDEPVQPRDAAAAVRKRLDVELELLIPRDGSGHRTSVLPLSFPALSLPREKRWPAPNFVKGKLCRKCAETVSIRRAWLAQRRHENLAFTRPVELAEEDPLPASQGEVAVVERDEHLRAQQRRA